MLKLETPDFITEAKEYINKDINMTNLEDIRKYLYKQDRAFIWDYMIKKDRNARELMSEALRTNSFIALRSQINPRFNVESVLVKGKKQKRIRDKKTGRFVSAKKKGVFEGLRS